nr:hypothetical protein [Streptococcus canis]
MAGKGSVACGQRIGLNSHQSAKDYFFQSGLALSGLLQCANLERGQKRAHIAHD